MTAVEAADYIRKDIGGSIVNDVHPCLNLGRAEGGVFAVPRLILAYVDYLGVLYHGYSGRVDRHNRRVFSTSDYAEDFLTDVLGVVHKDYIRHGKLLWQIYRHGTVHLYEPLTLRNPGTGQTIEWYVFKAEKEVIPPQRFTVDGDGRWIVHLVPRQKPNQTDKSIWVQPVSINCLYHDLLGAVETYATRIVKEPNVHDRFKSAVNALLIPEETQLQWP